MRNLFLTATLNIWFYFWAPFVLFFSLIIYTPYVAFIRIFYPSKTMHAFRRCINLYGKSVALTACPWLKVTLHTPPPPEDAPYIFVENHTSSFDPFVQGFLPFELVQAARGWALHLPILGFVARLAGYLDVDNLTPEELLEKSENHIRNKVSLVFFPEGTRQMDESRLGPFHSTAFRAAAATAAPIVPVIISGISDKPRKGSLIMRPGRIDIHCLQPLYPDKNKTHITLKKAVRKQMEEFIKQKQEGEGISNIEPRSFRNPKESKSGRIVIVLLHFLAASPKTEKNGHEKIYPLWRGTKCTKTRETIIWTKKRAVRINR